MGHYLELGPSWLIDSTAWRRWRATELETQDPPGWKFLKRMGKSLRQEAGTR